MPGKQIRGMEVWS